MSQNDNRMRFLLSHKWSSRHSYVDLGEKSQQMNETEVFYFPGHCGSWGELCVWFLGGGWSCLELDSVPCRHWETV